MRSSQLYVGSKHTCMSCGTVQLSKALKIYRFRSKKFQGKEVVGCGMCLQTDSDRSEFKEYTRNESKDTNGIAVFTQTK